MKIFVLDEFSAVKVLVQWLGAARICLNLLGNGPSFATKGDAYF
jgi:hypothetical protein